MNIDGLMNSLATNMIVMFVGITIVTLVLVFFIMRYARNLAGVSAAQQQIMQTGIPAQAQVTGLQQTNSMINNNPVAIVHLNVQPPSGAAYPVQVRRMIPLVQLMQFQPGMTVPVMIDRDDPSKVVIAI